MKKPSHIIVCLLAFITMAISVSRGAAEQGRSIAAAEMKRKAQGGPHASIGEGCQSNLMTLVESSGAIAKGCLIGRSQWRFWCLDGSIYDEAHSCSKAAPTIQAAEGEGCKSELLTLVEENEVWGKGCSIGTNQWRFWCSNGRVYEEVQPSPPPVGGVGRLCNPAADAKQAAAIKLVPGQPAQRPVGVALDQDALGDCVQQILARNQCPSYLTTKEIRQLETRGQSDATVVVAEIEMETIQEFEVRSDVASNCTGTWWKEDPQYTRYQFSFPEAKYFVKVGQHLKIRKTFPFKKNEFGWRCQVQSMKPVDDAFLTPPGQ